jgi:hypothetical protein
MGQLADTIENTAAANIPAAPVASAADLMTGPQLLQIFGEIVMAVAALELITAGASFHLEAAAPGPADGGEGDAWLNALTGDLFKKVAGVWEPRGNLKGLPGKDGKNGKNGTNGTNGTDGLSTYQLWLQDGHAGTLSQFLASLRGTDGTNGTRGSLTSTSALPPYSPEYVQPTPGQLQVLPEAPEGSTLVFPALPGDMHYQRLSAERYALHRFTGSSWVLLYTTPAAAVVPDGSITDAKLASDVKIGSNAAAANAYPAADRAQLSSVEKFLVYIGGKLQDIYQRLSAVDALNTLVQGFNGRIAALEQWRAAGGSGTGTGTGTGTASYPAQSAATAGKFLQSSGVAGAESWGVPTNKRVGWIFSFKNEIARNQRYFKTTAINLIEKDAGVSTLSYSINGGTAVQVVFTGNTYAPAANTPLSFPAGALITWAITYNSSFTEAAIEIEGTEA